MSRDYAASIRARLLNQAKHTGEEFELFLVRYACERFLYRLGASEFRDRCILKGAALLSLWMGDPYRATRDLDFLAYGPNDEASIRNLVKSICDMPCTLIRVTVALNNLAEGLSEAEIVVRYPTLTAEDIHAAIAYAEDGSSRRC